LIAKTKRIAERSDTNCDTHTDRQSTLDEYVINIGKASSFPSERRKNKRKCREVAIIAVLSEVLRDGGVE
jgi:hypothetical protein